MDLDIFNAGIRDRINQLKAKNRGLRDNIEENQRAIEENNANIADKSNKKEESNRKRLRAESDKEKSIKKQKEFENELSKLNQSLNQVNSAIGVLNGAQGNAEGAAGNISANYIGDGASVAISECKNASGMINRAKSRLSKACSTYAEKITKKKQEIKSEQENQRAQTAVIHTCSEEIKKFENDIIILQQNNQRINQSISSIETMISCNDIEIENLSSQL